MRDQIYFIPFIYYLTLLNVNVTVVANLYIYDVNITINFNVIKAIDKTYFAGSTLQLHLIEIAVEPTSLVSNARYN